MAITFRANKGSALTYTELDQNFGQFFYSSSVAVDGTALTLHYTGSNAVTSSNAFIVSGSKVGINTTNSDLPLTYNLEVSGSIRASSAVLSNSDARLKENINNIDGALTKIVSSRGVTFNRTESPDRKEIGVIAQEIEKILPEVVYKDNKDYLSVNYSGIVPVLIESIKELEQRVKELENK